ncbi:hypothetical protein [Clostridioides difficile]|nr:hypothetical protein [Clostridioides difficile]
MELSDKNRSRKYNQNICRYKLSILQEMETFEMYLFANKIEVF